jgi:hypothetical protein
VSTQHGIVAGAFLNIGENLVGLMNFGKTFALARDPGVDVGVPLFGQMAKCDLDLLLRGVAINAKNVIIAILHGQPPWFKGLHPWRTGL